MIVFDLRCGQAHVFEARFASSAAYEDQRARGLIACPVCNDDSIDKAVMAPNIAAKGNSRPAPRPEQAALAALAEMQARLIEKSEWVGRDFPDRARAMHLGDAPATLIHGETTAAEARELAEEGVPIAPLLVPVVPPHARN
ncbi:DUF1178 family protein [Sphingomonas sp.]|uniref:DUF1178 family protein n=1 Tax=Sphingomonas sp. TaxID=28214 RepID=UPI001DB59444|nr:DUF1178 family protein [Sphingomonas sp.]MBX9796436.1 DUF1178 family protein [Sphingomonas sp.]